MCKWKPALTTVLLLFSALFLQAQNFTDTNHAYWYQPNPPVKNQLFVWKKGSDSLQVMASVQINGTRNLNDFRILLYQRNQLDTIMGTSPLTMELIETNGNRHLLKADIPVRYEGANSPTQFLLLELKDVEQQTTSYWAIASLAEELSFPPPPFFLLPLNDSFPLFRQYIKENTALAIQGQAPWYTYFFYDKSFEIASPPMTASPASSGLDVTGTGTIHSDSLFLPSAEGLYFIQHDTSQLSGQGFRAVNPYFPEVGTLEDFAGPIRYLSTNDEWIQLEKSNFSKKELDRFWLKIAQTEERAKRIIKHYYQRVSQANTLFTNYKEGWKTDQGMIYILYGPPDVVNVKKDREEWIYRQTTDLPEIKFNFVRVKNPFTDRHFVLLRSKNYTKSHYQIVSKWRKGKNTL